MEIPVKEVTIRVLKGRADDYVRTVMDSGLGFGHLEYNISPDGLYDYVVFYIPDCSSIMPDFPRRFEIRKSNLEFLAEDFLPKRQARSW